MNLRFLIVFAVVLSVGFAWAGLDDPVQKKVTVGTEIYRGYSAISGSESRFDSKTGQLLPNELLYCQIIFNNQQRNSDTPAFQMGASMAMLDLYQKLIVDKTNPLKADEKAKEIHRHIDSIFRIAKTYNLTKEDIAIACDMDGNRVKALLELETP